MTIYIYISYYFLGEVDEDLNYQRLLLFTAITFLFSSDFALRESEILCAILYAKIMRV